MGSELTLIGFYSAGLYFALQHIAERYSPVLAKRILHSWKVIAPIVAMVILAVFSWIANDLNWKLNGTSVLIIFSGLLLALVLYSTYRMLSFSFSYRNVINWIPFVNEDDWLIAVQDVLSAALSRSDERVVTYILTSISSVNPILEQRLLSWAVEDSRFSENRWVLPSLFTALVELSIHGVDSTDIQNQITDSICTTINQLIQRDSITEVETFVVSLMDKLSGLVRWNEYCTILLFYVIQSVWFDFDSKPRTVVPNSRLESLQTVIVVRLQHFGSQILEVGTPEDLETYICYLGRLMEDTHEDSLVNKGMDLIEWGLEQGKVTEQALHEFSNSLGHFRRKKSDDNKAVLDDWININVVQMAAGLAHIKGKDLHRLLANGGVRCKTISCFRLSCLSSDDYREVELQGGVKVELSERAPSIALEFKGT